MTAKVGSYNLNELSLYHGTDHSVVDGICAQNFDVKLSSKNATAYGQGSYFAKDASYSHSYATKDEEKFRYMFAANVLVGRYTEVMKISSKTNAKLLDTDYIWIV